MATILKLYKDNLCVPHINLLQSYCHLGNFPEKKSVCMCTYIRKYVHTYVHTFCAFKIVASDLELVGKRPHTRVPGIPPDFTLVRNG